MTVLGKSPYNDEYNGDKKSVSSSSEVPSAVV